MHPQLEMIDQIVRIVGLPTLLCVLVWVVRTWDRNQRRVVEIDTNTKNVVTAVAVVKETVDLIKSNHLAHLQDGISQVAESNDKAVELLQNISVSMAVLVDRATRN